MKTFFICNWKFLTVAIVESTADQFTVRSLNLNIVVDGREWLDTETQLITEKHSALFSRYRETERQAVLKTLESVLPS